MAKRKKSKSTAKKSASKADAARRTTAGSKSKPKRKTPARSKKSRPRDATNAEPTPMHRLHVWQYQAVRDLLWLTAVLGVFWAGYALRAVTVPLLVALMLAYLAEPALAWMRNNLKWIRTRAQAVSVLLGAGGAVLIVTLSLVLPLMIAQTTRFVISVRDGDFRAQVANLGQYVPGFVRGEFDAMLDVLPGEARVVVNEPQSGDGDGDSADPTTDDAPADEDSSDALPVDSSTQGSTAGAAALLTDAQLDQVRELFADQRDEVGPREQSADWLNIAKGSADTILGVIGTIIQLGLVAFLIPFYFFFFSMWYPDVLAFARRLLPTKNRGRTLELMGKMDQVVAGFVRGRIVISLIMGVLLAIGWTACGVPYGIAIGLITGVFCAIPYLGGIGVPVAIGLLLFDHLSIEAPDRSYLLGTFGIFLWPSVVFGAVQVFEGYYLTPRIAGKATNLDPVTIVVAVLAGGSVLGVYGMLLAIPMVACGKILLMEVLMPKVRAWTRGEASDPLPIDTA